MSRNDKQVRVETIRYEMLRDLAMAKNITMKEMVGKLIEPAYIKEFSDVQDSVKINCSES